MNVSRNKIGFTLIELIITLFIISLVSAVVIFYRGNTSCASEVKNFSYLFKAQMEIASEQAVLQMNVLGLIILSDRYEFYRLYYNKWLPLKVQDPFWDVYPIPACAALKISPNNNLKQPQILFYPSGEISPFIIQITNSSLHQSVATLSDPDEIVTLREDDK